MTTGRKSILRRPFTFQSNVFPRLCLLVILMMSTSVSAQNQITLRAVNWGGAEELKLEEEIADLFMQRHPNVIVKIETIPTGFKEKILTSIAAGSPPDVFLLDSTILPAFVNKSVLVDLMPYLRKYGIDLSVYFPNILNIAKRDTQLFAIPKDFNPVLMYYNKTLFREAGVEFPHEGWTWDDFLSIAKS